MNELYYKRQDPQGIIGFVGICNNQQSNDKRAIQNGEFDSSYRAIIIDSKMTQCKTNVCIYSVYQTLYW